MIVWRSSASWRLISSRVLDHDSSYASARPTCDAPTFDTLFRRARQRAGLLDLHFHDLRREATTRLAAKVDVMMLAKITGHRDVKLLMRTYYAPSMTDVAALLD